MGLQAVLEQEARIAGFKSEVQKSQELHHSSLTRDTDRLQTMLDKVKAEIRQALTSDVWFTSNLHPCLWLHLRAITLTSCCGCCCYLWIC